MSNSLNLESNRRKSFQTWPNNAPVDPDTLANNGFFATGNFLETQCNFCRKIISDWQYNDQVIIRHRRLNPNCPLLINPNNCNNTPLIYAGENNTGGDQSQSGVQDLQHSDSLQIDLKNEMCRLATFKHWPNPNISPHSLAKAGFYYINQADQVKCAWCKGIIAKWERNDNAFEEHQRFFPDCPRVQLGPLIEIASDGIRDLGIQQISVPKKPKYSCLDSRMRTYINWPIAEIQNPEILSQAGFYYQDIDDQVRCFHCNGGLRSWQKEDDPWFEHAKWFPHCQFLKLVKGPNYVTQVQQSGQESGGGAHEANGSRENGRSTGGAETLDPISTLDEAMSSEPVQRALEMGLNEGRILNATRRQLEYCGKPFDTTEELVEAVLEGQVDEEDDDNAEQSSSIIREVSQILNNIFNRRNNGVSGNTDEGDYEDLTPHDNEDFISFTTYHQNTASSLPPPPPITTNLDQEETPNTQNNEENNETNQPMSWVNMQHSATTSNNTGKTSNLLPQESSALSTRSDATSNVGESTAISATTINSIEDESNYNSLNSNSIPSCSSSRNPPIEKQISLEEENRKLKDARQCKVCMDDEVGVVFLPCGHLVTCVQCAPGVTNCPLCRSPIKGFVRTFLS